ncbi:hypothetical protein J1907_15160 [Lysinibacillus sphaericus]|uniref:hypothetical protein n=1 Tax=Lysinibacillus sphaericus TaxID=1421 RepID=UPI001A9E5FD3|nr:hypothetical protein [Lysinibacillus sphaericus]QTB21110.1 hypothetical protein J1907_15160 [Lysinibacillus sphaericus]
MVAVSKAKQQVKAAVKQMKQVVKEKVLPVVKKAAQATTKAVKNAVKPKNLLNTLQVGLDLVGLIPGFGEIADGVNGIIYLARGDKVNAALSFGAMIPFAGWAATGGKLVNKGAGVVKSVAEGVQKVLKGPVGSVVDQVKKQVVNVKTQIQSKVAEVKQQLRQMLQSQQDEFSFAGVDRRYIEDTGTVGRNTPTPSPKPSNTQPSQNGSNKKPTEDKGTDKGDDFAKEPFLPDKYYKNNYAPDDGTPGARFDFSRLGSSGQIENSRVIYDQAGKQKFRIDYSDHGNSLHHTNPHMHENIWQDGGKSAREIKYFVDPENGRSRKGKINIKTNRIEFID